jgi:NRAMP (natural resistance-associated macrophage protein)-like metal ion transporter
VRPISMLRHEDAVTGDPTRRPADPSGRVGPAAGARQARLADEPNPLARFLKLLGPGLITGASDDDPSGIGTYAVAGASLGFAILWTALLTFPLQAAVQYMCAKIGLVSKRGLAGVLRLHYPRALLYPAVLGLLVANTINVGADIGAIAAGVNLVVAIPTAVLIVPISLALVGLLVLGSYQLIANTFKWLSLALVAYIAAALFARPDWAEVVRGTLIPTLHLDGAFLSTLVAILGTTISPYLFFWQTDQEAEEQKHMRGATTNMEATRYRRSRQRVLWRRRAVSDTELTYAALDTNFGMLVSNVVMYFIILATAATLFKAGKTGIQSATDAAEALRPIAGDAAAILLASGLIGAGFLAVPILAGSASYAVSEAFGWRFGLDREPHRAPQFYAVIAASTLIGMLINFVGINPIDALFWTAVINGFLAPPLLVLVLVVANSRVIMGNRVNNAWTNALGGLATLAMTAAAIAFVVTGSGGGM